MAATIHQIEAARTAEERRARIASLDEMLARSDRNVILGCLSNLILIVGHDPVLADLFAYDEFRCATVTRGPPPAPIEGGAPLPGPYPRPWGSADVSHVQSYIQRTWTRSASKIDTEDAMGAVAAMRRFHPPRDWLNSLKWDGKPRLDSWLIHAFGAADTEYHAAVGAKFLIAAVRRVRRPGCKFDHMPVFEGPQGIGKSKVCRTLFGDEWFTDSLPSALESRDAALALQGIWLVEFAEIEQIIRNEVEVIKAFLSRPIDRFRAPYGKGFLEYPRQSVLVGTTNDRSYLRDSTGNRRFWPVLCLFADAEWAAANREQLFAEAAARENAGEALWLTETDVAKEATEQQVDRLQDDVWDERITGFVRQRTKITIPELLNDALMIPLERQGRREQMRVADILKRDGWQKFTKREGPIVRRGWERKTP